MRVAAHGDVEATAAGNDATLFLHAAQVALDLLLADVDAATAASFYMFLTLVISLLAMTLFFCETFLSKATEFKSSIISSTSCLSKNETQESANPIQ
ncbi:hypothetical protein [Stenotrophomonas maltophilia]|uniref:hypothetical protein n=1 Tax=Stenotrophomonas maltophilia TaxID=40324 RepID=UPI001E4666A7|nr:hypothetical protein [Stenotrophomonas maltophilia]